ncbi:hypothetical protein FACS189450_08320 [Spirochaetia bacterium]|nr:hypothetical protein FACS189450_08320 [Spirochaetia bacterium]
MKKRCFIFRLLSAVTVFILFATLFGCVSYQGQLDTSVPMKEQVTLITEKPLYLMKIDGKAVPFAFSKSVIKLPAGEHELEFSYEATLQVGTNWSTLRSEEITYSGSGWVVSGIFELGQEYTANWYGGYQSGRIVITGTTKNISPVTVAYESGVLLGLGMDLVNTVGFGWGFQPVGVIFDMGKVSIGLNAEMDMNMGWDSHAEMPIGFSAAGGCLFNLYINRNAGKLFGLGVGGGYILDLMHVIGNIAYDGNAPIGLPYLRAAIIPTRSIKIFFDYYLKDVVEVEKPKDEDSKPFDLDKWNSWGIGMSFRF